MDERLTRYRRELRAELEAILDYWAEHTVDEERGGFIGRITHDGRRHPEAPKGSVLNSRILWSFSAAGRLLQKPAYLQLARRAKDYLLHHFIDHDYGGVYWTVDADGRPLDTKKQIYALSFAVYGLSEYYRCCGDEEAKVAAIALYRSIVEHSYDPVHGGYIEALSREWKELDDLRLSAKDANERKSMNTHLHVLEGFANLYAAWPDEELGQRLRALVRIFLDRIISAEGHLHLFFADDWSVRPGPVSYGHDVEAAWLVPEAAELLNDEALLNEVRDRSLALARAAATGLDADGGLWYEYEPHERRLVREKHSWPQAEAMVGFFAAAQLSGDDEWLERSLRSWTFVKEHIRDEGGEWRWGVYDDYRPMAHEDKVGIWKCPYHNSRACLELMKRVG